MKDNITTTGRFANIDITHRSKRTQRDNIVKSGVLFDGESNSNEDVKDALSGVPVHSVTIERAIQYYEANATGDYKTLYSLTAKWLRQLVAVGMKAALKAVNESEETNNETTGANDPV